MRPGNGLTTERIKDIIGKKVKNNINKHELFKLTDFN
jgi:sialic acid synthase SpsE